MLSRRMFLAAPAALSAAPIDTRTRQWNARWIYPAGADPHAYGVYHFRRSFRLDAKPQRFLVHVSGDSRYELYVNGVKLCCGPARGDLYHWRYETVDLAPRLSAGANVLAAVVWNDGPHAAVAQWSNRTAFLLQAGDSEHEPLVNTGPDWRWFPNAAYEPVPVPTYQPTGYYAIGPCERFDAARHLWGWENIDFDDSHWRPVEVGRNASPRDQRDAPSRWMLVPRPIPLMEETPQRLVKAREATGIPVPDNFPAAQQPVTIPARTTATLLLDQGFLTCAFPVLEFSAGRGARIDVAYTEALFQETRPRRRKGNRNEVEGKEFTGYADTILADGERRRWRSLYWRTYRYIRVTVETADQPLTLEDLHGIYTGYPFTPKARFDSGDPLHRKILETGWRTARLCAHETYMDCPYYEQLQYAGDTRIQALVSLYMTGDARLMRNAIEQLDSSRTPEGATYSRAPSVLQQYIPPFSLWWIGMVHDYWRYVDDPAFVRDMLPGVRAVLSFYERYQREDGLLGAMPWWNYVDWVRQWQGGSPPCEPEITGASIHLQLLLAYQYAADLEQSLGEPAFVERCRSREGNLKRVIQSRFWTPDRRLFSEDLAHQHLSQHANVLAVLGGLLPGQAGEKDLMERVEPDTSLYKCSVYFRYYLDRAMAKAGLGGRYLDRLETWKFMIGEGLTTWAEQDNPYSRSDCHAWGASPNVEFFRTVLGVDSAGPGFSRIRVQPQLGRLEKVSGVVPHPKGVIEVSVTRGPAGLDVKVAAPSGVPVDIVR